MPDTNRAFFYFINLAEFVLWTNLYTDTAYTPSADVLEIFLHIAGTFFGVKIPFPIRGGQGAENSPCRASRLTTMAISAPIFDDGKLICKGHVRDDGGKAHFTAIFFREEKTAFPDKTKTRKHRRGLMRDYTAVGVVFAQTLTGGNGQGGKACLFNFTRKAESDLVKQRICRAVVLKIDERGGAVDGF